MSLPKYLLKEVVECLLPLITAIINKSLVESKVPLSFKKTNMLKLNEEKTQLFNPKHQIGDK